MDLHYPDCPLCGSSDTDELLSVDVYKYVRCKECGLVYLNPKPSDNALAAIYRGNDACPIDAGKDPTNEETLYLSRFTEKLNDINRRIRHKGKILDIGSAWGYFLSVAKKDGWETYGVELSALEGAYSNERFNINAFIGSLADAHFPAEYFDAITLWHVFEHIPSPLEELKEIKRILKKNGLLVIEVPSVKMLKDDVDLFLRRKSVPWHLFYYNDKTIRAMLAKAGLDIVKIKSCGDTGLITKAESLNIHLPKELYIKHYPLLSGVKKFLQFVMGIFNIRGNLIVYARHQ